MSLSLHPLLNATNRLLTIDPSSNVLMSSFARYDPHDSYSKLGRANIALIQGQEYSQRLQHYIEDFKDRVRSMAKQNNRELKIVSVLDNNDVSYASEFQTSEGNLQQ